MYGQSASIGIGLLLSVFCGVVYTQPYPPLWEKMPSDIKHYPLDGDKTYIDPWNYLQRNGLFKILLEVRSFMFTMFTLVSPRLAVGLVVYD